LSVKKVKTEDIIDYKKWWPDFYQKNAMEKIYQKYKKLHLKYPIIFISFMIRPNLVSCSFILTSTTLSANICLLQNLQICPDLPNIINNKAYDQKLLINNKKIE